MRHAAHALSPLGAWLLFVAFVVYGSLVPLDFSPLPLAEALERFANIRLLSVGSIGRADWIANGILYVPLGFLTVNLLRPQGMSVVPAWVIALSVCFALALAIAIEFAQLYFPPRTVSLNDLLAEAIGSAFGVALATRLLDRFRSLVAAMRGSTGQFQIRLLKAYFVAYLLFNVFPLDLIVSVVELREKAGSGAWGWLAADLALKRGALIWLIKLAAEVLATVPLGILMVRSGTGSSHPVAPMARALKSGMLLGTGIELVQFLLVSGVSQGASVLTRAMGMALGAMLCRRLAGLTPIALAIRLRAFALPALVVYVPILFVVNGWFSEPWQSFEAALDSFDTVRFLPFYYHYYTSEQMALVSLVAVAASYAPLGVLAWIFGTAPGAGMLMAVSACGMLETSKLFLVGQHPDPTNLLIAGAAGWLVAAMLWRWSDSRLELSASTGGAPDPEVRPTPNPARFGTIEQSQNAVAQTVGGSPPRLEAKAPLLGLLVASVLAAGFPFSPPFLLLVVVVVAGLAWRRQAWIPLMIPTVLVVVDLAPWSGRWNLDACDLVLAAMLAVGFATVPRGPARHWLDFRGRLIVGVLAATFALSLLRGLWPLDAIARQGLDLVPGPMNGLLLAKAMLWAWLSYRLMERLDAHGREPLRWFGMGLLCALAALSLSVVWERLAFPGLFDFASVYRVTGPFSRMNVGGSDIEVVLVASMPFAMSAAIWARAPSIRFIAVTLLVIAGYALLVTFSRMAIVAAAAGLFTSAFLALAPRSAVSQGGGWRRFGMVAGVGLILGGVAVAIVADSPFAERRIARIEGDFEIRMAHWRDALAMTGDGPSTLFLGEGLGRYPLVHQWRSGEPRAASAAIVSEGNDAYLRLGGGEPLYVDQFVRTMDGDRYEISLRFRSSVSNGQLVISLCQKWLLTSLACSKKTFQAGAAGEWVVATATFLRDELPQGASSWLRTEKLSLHAPAAGTLMDVSGIRLIEHGGESDLVENGSFENGFDHWYFSADNDLPWHVWSLPVGLLFEVGIAGAVSFGLLLGLALWRSARSAWSCPGATQALFPALLGLSVLGIVNTMIDSPRMLMLIMLICLLAIRTTRQRHTHPSPPTAGRRRARRRVTGEPSGREAT